MSHSTDSPSASSIRTEDAESITTAVVAAVTRADDGTPATPLYEAIDPDALDDLYRHSSPTVIFEYCGYRVTVSSDRTISVSELDA